MLWIVLIVVSYTIIAVMVYINTNKEMKAVTAQLEKMRGESLQRQHHFTLTLCAAFWPIPTAFVLIKATVWAITH